MVGGLDGPNLDRSQTTLCFCYQRVGYDIVGYWVESFDHIKICVLYVQLTLDTGTSTAVLVGTFCKVPDAPAKSASMTAATCQAPNTPTHLCQASPQALSRAADTAPLRDHYCTITLAYRFKHVSRPTPWHPPASPYFLDDTQSLVFFYNDLERQT